MTAKGGGALPNRILKESICVSESLNKLSWFDEVLFYRLIVNCDDFGRYDGRLPVIKNRLFPLKNRLSLKNVSDGLQNLCDEHLIQCYEVAGRPYLMILNWSKHQFMRAKNSKFPPPRGIFDSKTSPVQIPAEENNCSQMNSDEIICSRFLTETKTKTKTKTECESITPARKVPRGEYGNVFLSDREFENLSQRFPDLDQRIDRLSCYMESTGKTYKNHAATIRRWAMDDAPKAASQEPSQWAKDAVARMLKGG